jgi:hypothetical protein
VAAYSGLPGGLLLLVHIGRLWGGHHAPQRLGGRAAVNEHRSVHLGNICGGVCDGGVIYGATLQNVISFISVRILSLATLILAMYVAISLS